jgi:hypothetical protein
MNGIIMKTKQLIFIDDSGDAGNKTDSSSHLIMSAIVFTDDLVAEETALSMRKFRRQLGWTDDHEYKFHKTKKDYIKQILRLVSQYDFSIYALVVDKSRFNTTPKNLYNDTVSELLRIIPLKKASIKIDGHAGTNYTKRAISQVRKNAHVKTGQIADIKFADSKENVLIQLADLVASSIFRSTQNKSDSQDYIKILKKHITTIQKH